MTKEKATTENIAVLPEIQAIIDQKLSGAETIRKIYDLDPASFDEAQISKVTGINLGRIKGAIAKHKENLAKAK